MMWWVVAGDGDGEERRGAWGAFSCDMGCSCVCDTEPAHLAPRNSKPRHTTSASWIRPHHTTPPCPPAERQEEEWDRQSILRTVDADDGEAASTTAAADSARRAVSSCCRCCCLGMLC